MWRRVGATALSLMVCGLVFAEPKFLTSFREHFRPDPASQVGKADCQTCHTRPPARNAFGKIVEAELEAQQKGEVDDAVLKAVGEKRAPDGRTFAEIIAKGEAPAAALPLEPVATAPQPLVPNHSFHPAIVHFPIALAVFAWVLELAGWRRQDSGLRHASAWALGAALLTAAASLATGLIALNRLGFALEGKPLVHMCSALGATTVLATAFFFKLRKQDSAPAYWVLLTLAAVLVGLTGHLGSLMVYP